MAYTTGTATDYKNLLAVLATFAAANGWTVDEQSETQLYMTGEGAGGLDAIRVGTSAFENTSSGYYNWALEGAVSYRSGRSFGAQPGSSGGANSYMYLWNADIPYWIVATGRRIMMLAKVSTVYQLIHLGLGDPPATDAQYPYPLVIGGCGSVSTNRWSTTGTGNTMFCTNYGQTGVLRLPDGVWGTIIPGTTDRYVNAVSVNHAFKGSIITAPDGSYILDQIWLVDGNRSGTFCAIDGLFIVSGYSNSAENIITVDGVNYLVFQDVYRSGYGDYYALRLN